MTTRSIVKLLLVLPSIVLASASTVFAADRPHWRGRDADGVSEESQPPIHWSQTENIRWSVKLPGWGTSSPVVFGNQVYVTSQTENDGKKSLLLLCLNRDDGTELWRQDSGLGVNQRSHEKSNLAVNTPSVTDDAVYVAFGNADIARYSHKALRRHEVVQHHHEFQQ